MNVIDKLIEKIKETNNPTVIGLDPKYEQLPNCIKQKYEKMPEGVAKAILEFNKHLIDNVCDIIPSVKVNTAFYEMLDLPGMDAFYETCKYAKEKGMLVMADAKRGDIGSTSEAYANAFIGKTKIGDKFYGNDDIDFVTVNPYLGSDGIMPFVEACKKYDKGIFVITKTSNPSSGELQDLKLENGKTIYETVGDLVETWGEDLRGENGYSSVASVVGATYPEQLKELRARMPHTFFLIPGYGAQRRKSRRYCTWF